MRLRFLILALTLSVGGNAVACEPGPSVSGVGNLGSIGNIGGFTSFSTLVGFAPGRLPVHTELHLGPGVQTEQECFWRFSGIRERSEIQDSKRVALIQSCVASIHKP